MKRLAEKDPAVAYLGLHLLAEEVLDSQDPGAGAELEATLGRRGRHRVAGSDPRALWA
jgi:hypothetical protein